MGSLITILVALNLTLFSATASPSSKASDCQDELSNPERVRRFRESKTLPAAAATYSDSSGTYRVVGALGVSTWRAYLIENADGQRFLLKTPRNLLHVAYAQMLWAEIAKTEYFQQAGKIIPKVVSVKATALDSLAIVKEYHEGLTADEFFNNHPPSQVENPELVKIEEELSVLILDLQNMFIAGKGGTSFRKWYKKNSSRLIQQYPDLWKLVQHEIATLGDDLKAPNSLLDHDVFSDNMLFDVKLKQWILFDP